MANKKLGLGRGLDALLSGVRQNIDAEKVSSANMPVSVPTGSSLSHTLLHINIQFLQPSRFQPRNRIAPEDLQELTESIRHQGILQPLVVRLLADNQYEILAGERRFRAAEILGLQTVPVVVKAVSDKDAMCIALIENIQRKNLNVMEEAEAMQRLLSEFQLTQQELAQNLGKPRTTVSNYLRLMQLEEELKEFLRQRKIEFGHAKLLVSLGAQEQIACASKIVEEGLSVRATEQYLEENLKTKKEGKKEVKGNESAAKSSVPVKDPNIQSLENSLSQKLAAKLAIMHNQNGSGKIVIHYHSLEELEGILEHIGSDP